MTSDVSLVYSVTNYRYRRIITATDQEAEKMCIPAWEIQKAFNNHQSENWSKRTAMIVNCNIHEQRTAVQSNRWTSGLPNDSRSVALAHCEPEAEALCGNSATNERVWFVVITVATVPHWAKKREAGEWYNPFSSKHYAQKIMRF